MAFRKKGAKILEFTPDLLVVPESEVPAKLTFSDLLPEPKEKIWIGENPSKGIGVYSYSDFELKLHKAYDPEFRYIVPIQVSGKESFTLIAVWAMNDKDKPSHRYIGQVWLALQKYENLLNDPFLIIGDFNWNKIWDDSHNLAGNLTQIIEYLNSKKIISLYHHYFREGFGEETRPTFYMYRKKSKPYHIDYYFGSTDFINRLQSFEVGKYEAWHSWSDHMPIFCTFNPKPLVSSQVSD